MGRAATDSKFRSRVKRAFSSKGLDTGIGGTRIGRGLRDEAVREMYKKAAPKVGIGLLAVAAVGTGYYISKKNREKDLYDETLEAQPIERQNYVQESHRGFQQINTPQSTRRDPLVTAGVVGNLDRNKIGHTGMGPNKYNHLYGS
jgi:hypothetical protein